MSEHVLSYRLVDSIEDPEGTLNMMVYEVTCSCGWAVDRVAGARGVADAGRLHAAEHDE